MNSFISRAAVLLCILFASGLSAQTIERRVINTTGGLLAPSGGPQLRQNVGETYSTSLTGGGYRLTQGFIQPSAGIQPISGVLSLCLGATTTLSNATTGGTWSSSDTAVAAIGEGTGIVTGIATGTATISYSLSTLSATAIVTVSASPGSISGTLSVCSSYTTALSSSPSGGTWTTGNASRATVDGASGMVTGVSAGNVDITYTLAGGCRRKVTVTVGATPAAITGALSLCAGSTAALSSATTGGSWSSVATGIATVDAGTGVVTGVSTGTATISYSNGSCARTVVVTVNAAATPNTGLANVCVAQATTLSNATTGGTWSSSDAAVATVHASTGLVTGVSTGVVNITYTATYGCYAITSFTVNATVAAITGTLTVCPGATTTLSSATSGGSWSCSNTARATIDAGTGIVTGVSGGTVTISYFLGTGCSQTAVVTVLSLPAGISGTATVCQGATTTLTCSPGGGTWSSASLAIASITSGGVVTGVIAGNATITYHNASGCVATRVVTVTASAGTIGGTMSTCVGTTTTLTGTTAGGTWSSANTLRATIGSATGIATGVSAGTVVMTYALSASCVSTAVLTVTSPPSITGTALICAVCTSTLTGTPGGGTWTSSSPARATIGSSSGIVSGVSAGTTTMSYVAGGCRSTRIVTVNPSTSPSFGTPVVCVGQTNSTLSNPVPGGTWSSSNTSIATVQAATGILTGVAVGNANITYTVSPGSWTIIVATVGAAVANNVGTLSICPATTTTLTNATAGGSWLSTNTAIATVGNLTGIVTGVTAGTSSISYEVNVGCFRVSTFTIKSVPNITTTASTVVLGGTRTLSVSPGGGTWSSANPAIATATGIGTGTITGVSLGGTTVTYTNSAYWGGCFRTRAMTVVPARPDGPVVSETAQTGVLKVFPNPTSGSLTIDAPVAGTFTLYTIDGKEVAQYTVSASVNMVTLPSNLATGIYMSRFIGADGSSAIVRLVYEQ